MLIEIVLIQFFDVNQITSFQNNVDHIKRHIIESCSSIIVFEGGEGGGQEKQCIQEF